MKPAMDTATVSAARYEWLKTYKTDVPESRFRKELNPLAGEDKHLVLKAFMACIRANKAQYFSWSKFRDTWRIWLPSQENPGEIFDAITKSHTGYSPTIGVYWLSLDVTKRFGEKAFDALQKIGGVSRLNEMTVDNKKWAKRDFIEAYTNG